MSANLIKEKMSMFEPENDLSTWTHEMLDTVNEHGIDLEDELAQILTEEIQKEMLAKESQIMSSMKALYYVFNDKKEILSNSDMPFIDQAIPDTLRKEFDLPRIVLPRIHCVESNIIAAELIGVQPMSDPAELVFTTRSRMVYPSNDTILLNVKYKGNVSEIDDGYFYAPYIPLARKASEVKQVKQVKVIAPRKLPFDREFVDSSSNSPINHSTRRIKALTFP